MTAIVIGAFCGGCLYAEGRETHGTQCVNYKTEILTKYKIRELPKLPSKGKVRMPSKAFVEAIPASALKMAVENKK